MGGVTYTGGCIVSRLDGGFSQGGYTLRLPAGTHHLDGKQALALARTRENLCAPNETDIQREEHQQALFNDMKSQLLSPSSFLRLPLIAWNAPPAIISDMSGPTLLGLFAALAISGTPPTHVLKPTGTITLPDGEAGPDDLRSRDAARPSRDSWPAERRRPGSTRTPAARAGPLRRAGRLLGLRRGLARVLTSRVRRASDFSTFGACRRRSRRRRRVREEASRLLAEELLRVTPRRRVSRWRLRVP